MSPWEDEEQFENLLRYLRQNRGFDFTGYKRPSLMRRVTTRAQVLHVDSFADYVDYLEVHPEEFPQLFNTILINVTSFFRDPPAWEYLAREVLPGILQKTNLDEPVRVWSAGCASGEEAYTAAIMLAEAMGAEAFRQRVKIYATDIDEDALNVARQATYTAKDLQSIEEPLRGKYFEPLNGRYTFRTDLRRALIFGRHDLTQDAPISRLDLLICRNTIMYFNSEAQSRILTRFHFALNDNGRLFLGRAELLLTHGNLFTPLDLKARVFIKVPVVHMRDRLVTVAEIGNNHMENPTPRPSRLQDLALESSPLARIVVDLNGFLTHANQKARLLLTLNPRDIGRPLQDLEVSYRPVELRSLLEQAYAERRAITLTSVERRFPNADVQYLDIMATPLYDQANAALGVAISFADVSGYRKLQEELQRAREEIQTASEELQSSNEELETTNEELQSSNEELETTNEELQSTNEELETMNEELQSTNEELQAVNEELHQRTEEVNRANAFLRSIVTSLRSGAIVIDRQFNILVWNPRAEDLWGLREDEVKGQSVLSLDIGLPVDRLRAVVRPCLSGHEHQTDVLLDATNRRGKAIQCRITCAPLLSAKNEREGAILLMDEEEKP
ncbi:MAG: CheR family methyltransferase [Candidatus Binatia bacterium]